MSGAFILVFAAPALGMKLSFPDESAQARGTMATPATRRWRGGSAPGSTRGLSSPRRCRTRTRDTARLAAAVAATPGGVAVTPVVVSTDGQAAMLLAYPATGEQDPATDTLVNRIHDTVLPLATKGTGISAYVTGPNACNVSFANLIGQRLPWLIGVVVALSMLLLLVVFRSAVIGVKAAVMNLLSITAAYGVLVMIAMGWRSRS